MATKYVFKKTHEVDKDKFAELLLAAKGGRTMKDFAEICGVNPSTFTRIIQKTNKGASSAELIEAIAEHASPNSGVTVEALAHANGYTAEVDSGIKGARLMSKITNAETMVRNVLVDELVARGAEVRMGNIRYEISKSLALSADALIMTNAFGNEKEIWFTDCITADPYSTSVEGITRLDGSKIRRLAFDKFSRFAFISMNKVELFRPTRYSLVVFHKESFDIICEEFCETVVPTDITVIYIDPLNNCIADEYILPHIEKGAQTSYFMTTPAMYTDNFEYLGNNDSDEE